MKRADAQDVDSDADRRSVPPARRTSSRIEENVQPDVDRTVIEIDLGDVSMSDNVPGASTPNQNGD